MYLVYIMNLLLIIFSALLAIAFYTLRNRKFLVYIQYRKGPNKPTFIVLTIPIADAIKLFTKEEKLSILCNSNFFYCFTYDNNYLSFNIMNNLSPL